MKIEYDTSKKMFNVQRTNDIYVFYKEKGVEFSDEIITRYFLSLRTKPFVILTGISGTGKTKIAQIFADYMLQGEPDEEKKKRKAFVSVRPDWMDYRGLLGYYNLLDEKYYDTPVLRLILEAQEQLGKPYFIVLDEMNLAKVEHYFSDFLSTMESRTTDAPEGEPLNLHNRENVVTCYGRPILGRLNLPPNIYYTGTVNVDESTYMFSPKVLDRANVIEFNEVDLDNYLKMTAKEGKFILKDADVREALSRLTPENPFCSRKDYEKYARLISSDDPIKNLLGKLEKHNLHFGYRVVNEMSRFICNAKELLREFVLDEAVDIQILQKVLPKFHGTQAKLQDPLEDVFEFCQGRFPRSAKKIARMINDLKTQGYTSFI